MAFVTLHVGAGTFQPVRVDTIEDHIMHSEYAEVPQDVVDAVLAAKARGNRVIAVGTTSVRSLESAAQAAKNDLIGTVLRRYPNLYLSGLPVQSGRCAGDELPLARVDADYAGFGLCRLSTHHERL